MAGSAIDSGVADYKAEETKKKNDAANNQLYSEALAHLKSLGQVAEQVGFSVSTFPKPHPDRKSVV
jgi:hypothetical protein